MIDCLFLDTDDRRYFSAHARQAVQSVCDAAEPAIRQLLPMLPDTIELVAQAGESVILETGEMGSTVSTGRITWVVDPARPSGVASVARSQLRATLFHECHHIARGWTMLGNKYRSRFIDGVICEGLATAFERDFGGRAPPWGEYSDEALDWVGELLALPPDASYRDWMFQHPDGRRWIGYRAGTLIVDKATVGSGQTASTLVRSETREILAMAGF